MVETPLAGKQVVTETPRTCYGDERAICGGTKKEQKASSITYRFLPSIMLQMSA
jgi:hypothetical protein